MTTAWRNVLLILWNNAYTVLFTADFQSYGSGDFFQWQPPTNITFAKVFRSIAIQKQLKDRLALCLLYFDYHLYNTIINNRIVVNIIIIYGTVSE